jgi:hypothetical protein
MSQSIGSAALPLDASVPGASDHSARRIGHLTWAFVGLGVLLRVTRYLLQCPLWADECFVAINYIDTGFGDMLRPLRYAMVCPLFVLWSQLASVKLFGFCELSLRLPATLASLGSLLLFRYFSGRVLQGWPWLLAVGIFAVSYYPIRHGCEVKPYAMDLFVALALLTLAVEWLRDRDRPLWWWLLAAAMPIALGSSHPATFVAGGISLALALAVYRTRNKGVWVAFAAYNVAVAVSFLGWYWLVAGVQSKSYEEYGLKACWDADFPPLHSLSALAAWLIDRHTSHMFSYPIGGAHGGSTATVGLLLVALAVLCRRRHGALAALCFTPLGLCFVAAALHKYPYGGSQRTMQFMAPACCILAGLGMATLVATCTRWRAMSRAPVVAAAVLAAVGLVGLGRDLLHPYKTVHDFHTREFARWFWKEQAHDAEVKCCIRDLDIGLAEKYARHSAVAVYVCNQQIYSRHHRGGLDLQASAGAANRPVRCVTYGERLDDLPEFKDWLARIHPRYALRGSQQFHVNSGVNEYYECFVVYELVPRDLASTAVSQAGSGSAR